MAALALTGARCFERGTFGEPRGVWVARGVVVAAGTSVGDVREIPLDGRLVLPALVNAHDVLDQSTLPVLGAHPPYRSLYEWTSACAAEMADHPGALAVPLVDRLFLGGLRNLLAGAASVLHHHADHRSLGRSDFPVRVQRRYGFAHSPGLTPALRRTYRTSDRRIPWVVRAAEGSDPRLRGELALLAGANVLRQNTVIARGTALEPDDAAALANARASLAWCPESDLRLYGRTAPAPELLVRGVRVGLGSDGAAAGARDLLSTLASARAQGGLDDAALVNLATHGSAGVARLPVGGFEAGAPADLLVIDSLEALLEGDRRAVLLLLVRGEPVYGVPELVEAAGRPALPLFVDGERRALDARLGRRFASLLRRHPAARQAAWLAEVAV
jgi:cytosine/adenosine deaminase-related metal-dependent hydrolase